MGSWSSVTQKLCVPHIFITYHIYPQIYITPVCFPIHITPISDTSLTWSPGHGRAVQINGSTPSSLPSSSLPERYKLYIIQSFLQSSSSLLGTDTVPPYCTIKLFLLTPAHFEDQQFCVLCGATLDSKKYMEKLNNAQP